MEGEDDESLSKRLGVRREVLEEARAELAQDLLARGLEPHDIGRRTEAQEYLFKVPEVVHEALRDLSVAKGGEAQKVTPTAFMRSLIVRVLEHPDEPKVIHRLWRVWGQSFSGVEQKGHQIAIKVSRGAMMVFDQVASERGTTRAALLRSITIDFLEDRVPRLKLVLSSKDMLNDPDVFRRYRDATTRKR